MFPRNSAYTLSFDDEGRPIRTTWRAWRGGTHGSGYQSFPTEAKALEFAKTSPVSHIDCHVNTTMYVFDESRWS